MFFISHAPSDTLHQIDTEDEALREAITLHQKDGYPAYPVFLCDYDLNLIAILRRHWFSRRYFWRRLRHTTESDSL